MAAQEGTASGAAPGERTTIGISFGNSNSSIAYTTAEDKSEVIANEEGGKLNILSLNIGSLVTNFLDRSSNSFSPIVH